MVTTRRQTGEIAPTANNSQLDTQSYVRSQQVMGHTEQSAKKLDTSKNTHSDMNIEHDNTIDASAEKLDASKSTHSDTNIEHDNTKDASAEKLDTSKSTHPLDEGTSEKEFFASKDAEFHERGEESYISEQITSE